MFQVVIFDMDGVLIDSEPLHLELEHRIFEELGIQMTPEHHEQFVGMAPTRMWETVKREFDVSQSVEELKQNELTRKLELMDVMDLRPIDGVVDLLNTLQQERYSLALASSSPRKLIDLMTGKADIKHYFDFIISGEELENGKPDPDIFLCVADHFSVEPEHCLVIEDSRNGVRAAKAANMKCVGFGNQHSGQQDLSGADLHINGFDEISTQQIRNSSIWNR